ncbi:hypothetical protein D3C75_1266280 [compost metagenome]
MVSVQRQEPAPRPLDDHQLGPGLLYLSQARRQAAQADGLAHFPRGYMGRDWGFEGEGVDPLIGQRQAGGLLQQ